VLQQIGKFLRAEFKLAWSLELEGRYQLCLTTGEVDTDFDRTRRLEVKDGLKDSEFCITSNFPPAFSDCLKRKPGIIDIWGRNSWI